MTLQRALLGAAVCVAVAHVGAQSTAGNDEPQVLPALTPITLVIDDTISSNVNHNGDTFELHVANDVAQDGVVLIPAGSPGEGEVVHAARSRAGGKAGELILAARYVMVGDRKIRLRSFAAGSGADHTPAAIAVAVLAGPAAFLVKGGEFRIPVGSVATAKTAEENVLHPIGPAKALPAEADDRATTTTSTEESRQ